MTGPGAEAFLDELVANTLPKKTGSIKLTHALDEKGGVRTEFTIMRDGPEAFYLVSSGAAERYDHDLLLKLLNQKQKMAERSEKQKMAILSEK